MTDDATASRIVHTADALRLLVIARYGGFYSDTDVVFIRFSHHHYDDDDGVFQQPQPSSVPFQENLSAKRD